MASSRKASVGVSSAPKKIAKIQFGTLSSWEIQKAAELHITNRDLFTMPNRSPALNGCLDPHLGISDKRSNCLTCK